MRNLKKGMEERRRKEYAETAERLARIEQTMKDAPPTGNNAMLERTEKLRKEQKEVLTLKLHRLENADQRKERLSKAAPPVSKPAPVPKPTVKEAKKVTPMTERQMRGFMTRQPDKLEARQAAATTPQVEKRATVKTVPAAPKPAPITKPPTTPNTDNSKEMSIAEKLMKKFDFSKKIYLSFKN